MADSPYNTDDQILLAKYNAQRGGDVDMSAVQADVARRNANPAPIDTNPATFTQRNPGPRDPLTAGVAAAATGHDPQRAMAATLGQRTPEGEGSAQPQQGGGGGAPEQTMDQGGIRQPADYLRWDEVVQQREFLHLPVHTQEQLRQRYFDTIVAPRVNPDDLPAVKIRFNALTTGAAGMSLIPNNDDYNIEPRQQQSQALQQRYGLPANIADKVAYAMYPQKDSRTHIVGAQVAEGAKVFVDKVGEHIGIPFTDYDLYHAANWLTGGTKQDTDLDKIQAQQNPRAALAGTATGQALGIGGAVKVLGAAKAAVGGYAARGAQEAEAAANAKFANTPADEILAKDAAANPPRVNPENPFNASGGVKGTSAGVAGSADSLTAAERAALAKDPALAKAYGFIKAHPAFTTAGALGLSTGGFGLFPQASLIYHIARSIKGIAKLLPEVTGGG